ncbi:MAG: Wzz/FepE/Etk N-terminal domain-containing protein [Candidatus Bipolaricaulia bacterium]
MEEYEVDLRDYFRVMWRKKWIILGVFLVAVVAALLLSFRMPSQYKAEAFYQLNRAPQATGINLSSPSSQVAVAMLGSRELLQQAVREAEVGGVGGGIANGLKVTSQKGNLLQLELKGTLSPDALQGVLTKLVGLFSVRARAQLQGEIEKELSRIEKRIKLLEGERTSLTSQISELLGREGNAQLKVG